MENGFNENELADIMSEIETLEDEFTAPEKETATQKASSEQPGSVQEIKAAKPSAKVSAMNFSVRGDMQLNLEFDIADKKIELRVTEHGFELELDDGVKFTLPVSQKQIVKKAA